MPVGELGSSEIHTSGIYIDYLVQAHTTLEELGTSASVDAAGQKAGTARRNMARRALAQLLPGDLVISRGLHASLRRMDRDRRE